MLIILMEINLIYTPITVSIHFIRMGWSAKCHIGMIKLAQGSKQNGVVLDRKA